MSLPPDEVRNLAFGRIQLSRIAASGLHAQGTDKIVEWMNSYAQRLARELLRAQEDLRRSRDELAWVQEEVVRLQEDLDAERSLSDKADRMSRIEEGN